MPEEMAKGRAPTGISEFDAMLNGGFMKGDCVLVTGAAGTGKTNLALQFLYNGVVKYGENAVYVTFEQMPDQIYRDAKNLGMNLEKLEEENRLKVISTSPDVLVQNQDMISEFSSERAERIVIDSISYFELSRKNSVRDEIYTLIRYLKTKGATSMLLHEAQADTTHGFGPYDHGLSFLADTVVVLKYVEIESAIRRAVAILKMRGSDHEKTLREIRITSKGIEVGGSFEQWEGVLSGAPHKSFALRVSKAFGGI
ncbi:putative KaiC family protein kinase [Nitrososphaera viennensis EN76]|nr:putative KaiC family protein kinase [Nitrososphaera viennensis EN76]